VNAAQKQFLQSFSLAVVSLIIFAVGWEYYPGTRVWLPIILIVINGRGLLRDFRNIQKHGSLFQSDAFVGVASRKPWIAWVLVTYAIAAAVFLILAVTAKIDVSDIGLLQLLLMLLPLGIPGTVVHYERLGDE
jgi:hypothetical protein